VRACVKCSYQNKTGKECEPKFQVQMESSVKHLKIISANFIQALQKLEEEKPFLIHFSVVKSKTL
jgi:hypothetical protein